jgi:hypothetical protein
VLNKRTEREETQKKKRKKKNNGGMKPAHLVFGFIIFLLGSLPYSHVAEAIFSTKDQVRSKKLSDMIITNMHATTQSMDLMMSSDFCCIIRADSAEQRSLTRTRRSHARHCLDFTTDVYETFCSLSTSAEYGAIPSSQRRWRRCCFFICVTAIVT